ncbi:MAG: beta-galactosidase family protein [Bacteroidia bacterium]
MKKVFFLFLLFFSFQFLNAQDVHTFSLDKNDFLLDGKPFQFISGEMHPARIPKQYWKHRIQMAKAMGCNTIAVYVFWNYHESSPGVFDFKTENRNIAEFIRLCKEEGLWVLLRPGPYVCGERDWGGLPSYLLKIPDIKVRCMDAQYMAAVKRYVAHLSKEIVPLQCINGGPILMVQIENEYGSYSNDKTYLKVLRKLWIQNNIRVPFYTADGPAPHLLESGSLDSCAIGLDPGVSDNDFAQAEKQNPNVPAFCSELYPGWLTHWGEAWQKPDTTDLLRDMRYLLLHKKSLNLYVIHGGTNFGFTAGANAFSPTQYQPDVTSYDYDAPINEQGNPTYKYFALRNLIAQYVSYKLPDVPAPISSMEIPAIKLQPFTDIWNNLPKPFITPQPEPMENFNQKSGFILYRTKLIGPKGGNLIITEPHDYALIFLDRKFIDTIYRDGGKWNIELPQSSNKEPILDIFVEAMGRINFAQYLIDRKGITDRVTLNGITLTNWQTYSLPMDEKFISSLQQKDSLTHKSFSENKTGTPLFFKGNFDLNETGDTYLDMHNYKKGVLWVNGHNLGRYWNKGPQFRLYCPATFLKKGKNEIIVFDLHQQEGAEVRGVNTLE